MQKFRMYKYKVAGRGEFPYDMLRYDESFPDKELDSLQLGGPARYRLERTITLVHFTIGASNWEPTADRWESFSWRVTDVEEMS